jgi:hypothetical protein
MLFTDPTLVDEFEIELAEINAQTARLQARQLVILHQLERAQVHHGDGARNMIEWTATALDVTNSTARELVAAANRMGREDPWLFEQMQEGKVALDRAVATLRLSCTDAPASVVDRSLDLDLSAVSRLTHKYRRIQSSDERQTFADRYFAMQPSLDESRWRGWFELPGVDGRIVDKAIADRADDIRSLPYGDHFRSSQRRADALVALAQDSLDGSETETSGSGPNVAVFVDLEAASASRGEMGVEVEYGPRVGPEALRETLCTGSVQLIGLQKGKPVITSDNTNVIPPAVRKFVAWRDGSCSIAGCHSRYRLQPHHIRHRAEDGDHDPEKLTTLCWFHHHVAIHGAGFRIQTNDPPGSRRLIRPWPHHHPP